MPSCRTTQTHLRHSRPTGNVIFNFEKRFEMPGFMALRPTDSKNDLRPTDSKNNLRIRARCNFLTQKSSRVVEYSTVTRDRKNTK